MANTLLSSKVSILEEEPRIRSINAVQTSIAAMVGVTERGPIATPTLVTSFDEFRAIFGGFTADADATLAAQGFFENGGQFLYMVRTVHYTDPATAATKTSAAATINLQTPAGAATPGLVLGTLTEPFNLEPGDDLDIAVDGNPADTATFDAAAATRTSGNTETFDLSDGLTLTVSIDGGSVQTVIFNTAEFADITNATALEVATVMNAELAGCNVTVAAGAVVIISDKRGTDSGVNVTGGTANTGGVNRLNFTTGNIAGTGDVADIDAVTVAEIKAVVEADVTAGAGVLVTNVGGAVQIQSNTTGGASSIHVEAGSTADDELGLDNATHNGGAGAAVNTLQVDGKTDGAYGNDLSIMVTVATSGDADEFNLIVLDDGLVAETFPNLSMVDTAARYAETVINAEGTGSNLIAVTDLDASVDSQRPANGTSSNLSGGDDGLTGLADTDFIGDSAGPTGIRALDTVQDVNLLLIPGQATSAIQNAMITYCEDTRAMSMFAVLDPPAGQSATQIITYVETTALLLELSEFGAIYWPYVKILNPATAVFGDSANLTVPPSGIVAGVYARTDGSRPGGVYLPPAGEEEGILRGVIGFETDEVFDELKRDLVYPKRINPLTSRPGSTRHIDGSRTLKSNGNFPYISQRRGAIFIEQSIKRGTEVYRHKNNTPALRRTIERSIRGFLVGEMKVGAFASNDPDKAFFVDFSDKLNTADLVAAGQLNGRVGLAFNTPAEWVIIKFSRDTRAIEEAIANA